MADQVLLKTVWLLMRWLFGLAVLVSRRDRAKDAELLVLRHENAVLRRNAGRVRYEPTDRVWFAALTRFIPRRRWAGLFPVTPATLLSWHRRLAARKYDTSNRRRPGRPAAIRSIARLTIRLAQENPLWGDRRICECVLQPFWMDWCQTPVLAAGTDSRRIWPFRRAIPWTRRISRRHRPGLHRCWLDQKRVRLTA